MWRKNAPRATVMVLSTLALTGLVCADLEEAEDPVYGPGALTVDTDQDLAFLDPVFTLGLSFPEMELAFEDGGAFAGFRHATVEEVAALLNNGGFTPALFPPYDDPFGFVIFPSGQAMGALAGLQDMLSVTITEGGLTATLGYTQTASVNFDDARLGVTLAVQRSGFGVDFASVTPIEEMMATGVEEAAHWLIRVSDPTPKCAADFNRDDVVDIIDFGIFGSAFGASEGDVNWDERPDFNGDGVIDIIDFGAFGTQFGDTTKDCNS